MHLRSLALAVLTLAFPVSANPQGLPPGHVDDFTGRPRVVVLSDIGNEPDDQMSLVRLLLYSNETRARGAGRHHLDVAEGEGAA